MHNGSFVEEDPRTLVIYKQMDDKMEQISQIHNSQTEEQSGETIGSQSEYNLLIRDLTESAQSHYW